MLMVNERIAPRTIALAVALLLIVLVPPAFGQAPIYPGSAWTRVPGDQIGWSEDKLKEARAYSAASNTAAGMIVVGRPAVEEWGGTTRRFYHPSFPEGSLG